MTKEEKCKIVIDKGFTYNPETGIIYGVRGGVLKNMDGRGYFEINFNYEKKRYYLKGHIFAWYWVNKECVKEIDHINRIRSDNRINNLRSVTRGQNMWNTKGKGFYYHKNIKKWHVQISVNNVKKHIGYFDTEEEANKIYKLNKNLYHLV